jgi:hypothetical protein
MFSKQEGKIFQKSLEQDRFASTSYNGSLCMVFFYLNLKLRMFLCRNKAKINSLKKKCHAKPIRVLSLVPFSESFLSTIQAVYK